MRIPHYIIRNHNGIYYFRYIIPTLHRHKFPNNKREFRRTLNTRNKSEAIKRAKFYWVKLMTSKKIDLDDDLDVQIRAEEAMLKHGVVISDKLDTLAKAYDANLDSEPLDIFLAGLNDYDKKCLNLYGNFRQGQKDREKSQQLNQPSSTQGRHPSEPRQLLSKVVEDYMGEMERSITNKSFQDYKRQLGLFMFVSDIKYVDEIRAETIRDYKNKIQKTPARLKTNPKTKNKNIDEILSLELPAMEINTLKKHIGRVSGFLTWLFQQQFVASDLSSILTGIKNTSSKKASDYRAIFDDEDLSKMFSVEEYQHSCFAGYPFRYWVPLLGLYTGARENELCQLHVDDIFVEDEIFAISIDDSSDDKNLKNKHSRRTIPIHSKLIELGFLDYVEHIKAIKENYLFPTLPADKDGKKYRNFSRFFNESYKGYKGFLARCKIQKDTTKGKKVFHSFRHTFSDRLKQLQINDHIAKQLLGHASTDITFGRYGKDYDISTLKENIEKIQFNIPHPRKWHKRHYRLKHSSK